MHNAMASNAINWFFSFGDVITIMNTFSQKIFERRRRKTTKCIRCLRRNTISRYENKPQKNGSLKSDINNFK